MRKAWLRFLHRFVTCHNWRMVNAENFMTAFDFSFECECGDTLVHTQRPMTVADMKQCITICYEFKLSRQPKRSHA